MVSCYTLSMSSIKESMEALLSNRAPLTEGMKASDAFRSWSEGDDYYFSQTFRNGDTIWFKPSSRLKNGNLRGKKTELYDGGRPSKPKQISISKLDVRDGGSLWKFHPKEEVPKNVVAKLG